MVLGIFASLIDKQTDSLNIFDVWATLFPNEKPRIDETWARIEPHISLIRDYRNKVSFHATKDLGDYIKAHETYARNEQEIGTAMEEFGKLALDLIRDEQKALPKLRDEIGPVLRNAGVPDEDLEKAKDYFI
jgi:hypothetical protein